MQTPGVIVMVLTSAELVGGTAGTQDSQFKRIITVFNALPDEFRFECPEGKLSHSSISIDRSLRLSNSD